MRIVSLRVPGWGSTSLAYGPYERESGLAFAAFVLNGHNTAQSEPLGQPISTRFKRWLRGNEVEPWLKHLLGAALHGRRAWTLRRFGHWVRVDVRARRGTLLELDENFSVGLVADIAVDPRRSGNSFVMHATGADNGELWAATRGQARRLLPGVRNVPLYLLVVVRGGHVLHLAGAVAGVGGLPALPSVRPLAVVPLDAATARYATIHQAVSGQIGFAADTRVWETIVADVTEWLGEAGAPLGAPGPGCLGAGCREAWAIPGGVGLIRVVAAAGTRFSVMWREGGSHAWVLTISESRCDVRRTGDGVDELVAEIERATPGDTFDVQITDDGHRIGVFLDADLAFDRWIEDLRGADGSGVSVRVDEGSVAAVEVYARTYVLPPALQPATVLPRPADGLETVMCDEFDGPPSDLEGRRVGDGVWRKATGAGRLVLTGSGELRADASAASPLPGRVAYTTASPSPGPVELEIDVLPPGIGRHEGERGRAGVIFEQDDGNALIVSTWLDDGYDGASISSFFRLGGFEDLYDAIWTNVARRVTWGTPYRLRAAFDGLVYEVFLDDELVIYRSLADVHPRQRPLVVTRVGIVANWEWGTDTGSVFRRWEVRAGRAARR